MFGMGIELYRAPIPERDSITAAMRRMEVGETFIVEANRTGLYAMAATVGIRIRTVKRANGRVQVWRKPDKGKAAEPSANDCYEMSTAVHREYAAPSEDVWDDLGDDEPEVVTDFDFGP